MKTFAFVILHYITIDDTKKCIESIIKNCNNDNIKIIVVDNASKNGSGKELEKLYNNNSNIDILINDENLGFSKGNNVGFKYAKEKYNPDYIILCNNDTTLLNDNFISLVENEYSKSKFAVLGPKILLKNNMVNPIRMDALTIKKFSKDILYLRIKLFFNYIFLGNLIDALFKKLGRTSVNNYADVDKRILNKCILHGCFLVFSKDYIKKFDGLDAKTFLYGEEELLYLRLKNNNMVSVYNPKITIFHNEYGSTIAANKSSRKKNIFVLKNMIKSCKVLKKELKK